MTPRTILIVDDDEDIRSNFSDILSELGYQTTTAADGETALQLARQSRYDIALLDYKMPGLDGLAVFQALHRLRPEMAVFLVTAFDDKGVAGQAAGMGVEQVISKPVDFPHVLDCIDRAMQRPLVLLVDDDADFRQGMWDVLHQSGFRIAMANDETSAVAHLEATTYDVVLLDIVLEQGDAGRILQTLRQVNPSARTILITGHRDPSIVDELLSSGADDVWYKPLQFETLVQKLRTI